mgnify:CR=1 FL=1|tara:strand:+ start:1137 stop:1427 length:291 start_codon:yes stop_codon:yes gene_type:complete
MYKVIYECDVLGDHRATILDLCEKEEIQFNSAFDAILFIEDCTSPITKVEEIIPWIANNKEYFTEMKQIAKPFSRVKTKLANIHLVTNTNDFKTLI